MKRDTDLLYFCDLERKQTVGLILISRQPSGESYPLGKTPQVWVHMGIGSLLYQQNTMQAAYPTPIHHLLLPCRATARSKDSDTIHITCLPGDQLLPARTLASFTLLAYL
ncbi:hypothetical protein GDO81_023868 [Engystomops pustulosus]|uniref:Uncharacterized protein n=1 Tax=Engystomops pustulosus TaxID=76066 RepID=A0AAV6YPY6_ENGPU|nr:hypothetical protein GDO81_023868 [Engystomops pustulosus]